MSETVFRSSAPAPVEPETTSAKSSSTAITNIEVPYLDYKSTHGHPHTVDYYQLGDSWQDPDGGFESEVSTIESYLRQQIDSAEIPNSISAVKEKLKSLEHMTNVSKEERPLVRIGTVAAYVKFLQETSGIKEKLQRYGTH